MKDDRTSMRVLVACWAIGGWLGTAGGVGVAIAVAEPTPDISATGYAEPTPRRDALPAPPLRHPDNNEATSGGVPTLDASTRAKANAVVDAAMTAVKAANETATIMNDLAARQPCPEEARTPIAAVNASAQAAVKAVAAASAAATMMYDFTAPHVDPATARRAVAAADASVKAAMNAVTAASAAAVAVFDLRAHYPDTGAATDGVAASRASVEAAIKVVAAATASADLVYGVTAHEGTPEASGTDKPTTGGILGLSRSDEPEWALVADASVTSIDFSKPTVSLGLERATPYQLAFVAVRKNTADNAITANERDRAFGQGVLAPSLANFSFLTHYEWRPWAYIRCSDDCRRPGAIVNTKKSKGGYATVEASYAKLTASNGTKASDYFAPVAASAGFIYRLEGRMPDEVKLPTGRLGLAGYAGLTGRAIAGDLDEAGRRAIFGTSRRYYWGAEAGATIQIGNVMIDPRLTFLTNGDDRVAGLTGIQLQINLSFLLPWAVLAAK